MTPDRGYWRRIISRSEWFRNTLDAIDQLPEVQHPLGDREHQDGQHIERGQE